MTAAHTSERPRESDATVAGGLHLAWSRLFIEALASSGVRDVVVSPGSRSTPLVLAALEHPILRCHVVVDERAAAFFALGQARVTGRPSVVVCTSGTAGAHYLPAVVEASHAGVPLVVVTADRPWELAGAGASQTIEQRGLFGSFVRHEAELGVPDPSPGALAAVQRIAVQSVLAASAPRPGPVHVNARFRKPLEPASTRSDEAWAGEVRRLMGSTPTVASAARSLPDEAALDAIADRCARAERGLIVCGPMPASGLREGLRSAVLDLAAATGFAVLAEATSQVRFGASRPGVTVCSSLELLLREPRFRDRFAPEIVLELGATPTSSGWAAWLERRIPCFRAVIGPAAYRDATATASVVVLGDVDLAAARIAARVAATGGERRSRSWTSALARADARATEAIAADVARSPFGEAAAAQALVHAAPVGSLLVAGNSLAVRHLDLYAPVSEKALGVVHQRGAAGIDGLVSGAAGAASAAGAAVAVLLGDLSVQHDVGGLALARSISTPLPIVVLQNGGGRIFEELPIARAVPRVTFERAFATPQSLDLEHAAAAFGVAFARVRSRAEIESALFEAYARPGATVVEAVVPPGDAAARIARLVASIREESSS